MEENILNKYYINYINMEKDKPDLDKLLYINEDDGTITNEKPTENSIPYSCNRNKFNKKKICCKNMKDQEKKIEEKKSAKKNKLEGGKKSKRRKRKSKKKIKRKYKTKRKYKRTRNTNQKKRFNNK